MQQKKICITILQNLVFIPKKEETWKQKKERNTIGMCVFFSFFFPHHLFLHPWNDEDFFNLGIEKKG
jgi:hypothetical protein